jgi:hypothetical protein
MDNMQNFDSYTKNYINWSLHCSDIYKCVGPN